MFYAVSHHGSAGMDSYGYAELVTGVMRRADQTTTVSGPYASADEAQAAVNEMNGTLDAWRAKHEE